MGIEFTDNSAQVKVALTDGVRAFLYESGGELQAQTMRNSRVDIFRLDKEALFEYDQGIAGIGVVKAK